LALQGDGWLIESEQALGHQAALIEPLAASNASSLSLRKDLGRSWVNLGKVQFFNGAIHIAEPKLTEACRLLRKLVMDNPDVPEYRYFLGEAALYRGKLHAAQGWTTLAKQVLEAGLENEQKLLRQYGNYKDVSHMPAEYATALASLEGERGQPQLARQWIEKALAELTKMAHDTPNDVEVLTPLFEAQVASLLLDIRAGRPTKLEQVEKIRQLVQERRQRAENDPRNIGACSEAVSGYLALAERSLADGLPADALDTLRKASSLLGPALQRFPDLLLFRSHAVRQETLRSEVLRRLNKNDEAAAAAKKAISVAEPLAQDDPAYLYDLACAYALQARVDPSAPGPPTAVVAALRAAIAEGFDNAYKLEHDDRLAQLGPRDEFRALIQRVKERAAKAASGGVANP
jgi:tetratricopeptide (TPR) repeat protein